jgi:hypothetical protein
MRDFAALKEKILAFSATGSYENLRLEIKDLSREMGTLISMRGDQHLPLRFAINEHPAFLSIVRKGDTMKFMVQTDQAGDVPFLLEEAAEITLLAAAVELPGFCGQLLQSEADHAEELSAALQSVRSVRDGLKEAPPDGLPEAEAAEEVTAQYVHNLRVRYEGLLELVRNENNRLHERLVEADAQLRVADTTYDNLFNLCEDVFCGSQGDVKFVNAEALTKLMEVVRVRAHENGDPR